MPVATHAAEHELWTYHLHGTVGAAVVGAILTLQDDRRFVAGHDFYADGEDVPLSGRLGRTTIELRERDGGTFCLHQAGAPGSALIFGAAPRLEGAWTRGGETRPVCLDVDHRDDRALPTRLYAAVTRSSDRVFEARVRRFVDAVLADDRTTASDDVSYPLRVDDTHIYFIRTRDALIRHWHDIFTSAVLAAMRQAIPHDMVVNEDADGVEFADGVIWFNARGAETINVD